MTKMTEESRALIEEEALRRINGLTNRQLSERTGLTPLYISQLISKVRRQKSNAIDVSHGTSAEMSTS